MNDTATVTNDYVLTVVEQSLPRWWTPRIVRKRSLYLTDLTDLTGISDSDAPGNALTGNPVADPLLDQQPENFEGFLSIKISHKIVLEKSLNFNVSELPRFQPHIVIDETLTEAIDE